MASSEACANASNQKLEPLTIYIVSLGVMILSFHTFWLQRSFLTLLHTFPNVLVACGYKKGILVLARLFLPFINC